MSSSHLGTPSSTFIKGGLAFVLVALGAAATACSADVTVDGAETLEQDLYTDGKFAWWSGGYGNYDLNINVCWDNPTQVPGATDEDKAAFRSARRLALERSWGRFSLISLDGWHACTSRTQPGLHIYMCQGRWTTDSTGKPVYKPVYDYDFDGDGEPDADCIDRNQAINRATGNIGQYMDGLYRGIRMHNSAADHHWVHEFGHALGFYHEEEKRNLDGAQRPLCGVSEIPTPSTPREYGSYDRESVMSYCFPANRDPFLSRNDIAGFQLEYGRPIGRIKSPRGNCVAPTSNTAGAKTVLKNCGATDWQGWSLWNGPNVALKIVNFSGFCLDEPTATSQVQAKITTCTAESDWYVSGMSVVGPAGMCLYSPGGATADGTQLELQDCSANTAKWQYSAGDQSLRMGGKCLARYNGAGVLKTCNGSNDQRFSLGQGKIKISIEDSCLLAQGTTATSFSQGIGLFYPGMKVGFGACGVGEDPIEKRWSLRGKLRSGRNPSLCLHRDGGKDGVNTIVELATCDPASNAFEWDFYF